MWELVVLGIVLRFLLCCKRLHANLFALDWFQICYFCQFSCLPVPNFLTEKEQPL